MVTRLAILDSDPINKYRFRVVLTALEGGLWEHAVKGTPIHLGLDLHRPVGWMVPFGLYLQPRLVRLLGRELIAQNQDEQNVILEGQKRHFSRKT